VARGLLSTQAMKRLPPTRLSGALFLIALLSWTSACRDTIPAEPATDASEASTGIETTNAPAASSTGPIETSSSEPTTTETTGASSCGDGELQGDERCDDGINDGAYGGCLPDCSALADHCGDGLVQPGATEACDDGEHNGITSCNAWCQISGTKIAEVSTATSIAYSGAVLAMDDGRIFVSTYEGRELWEVRDLGTELSSEHLLAHPFPWRSGALADLGDGRIAVAGGVDADHDLWVLDTEPFDDDDSMPAWVYHHANGISGGVQGLLLVDEVLWMFGDAIYQGENRQERAIHRINPHAQTWEPPIVTQWIGAGNTLRPRAIVHPSTGLIAVFQSRSGVGGLGMRSSVLDPALGEELSFQQDPTLDQPNAVCLRPDGQLAVFALPAGGAGPQQVVGYELDGDGELYRGASQALDLGLGNTFVTSCVSGSDVNLLVGSVDGNAFVLAVEDLLGERQSVVWQHIGVQIGFDAKEAAYGAAYRDGRFYVSFGSEAALAMFAR
jgi:cysteine-rich repeat protein